MIEELFKYLTPETASTIATVCIGYYLVNGNYPRH